MTRNSPFDAKLGHKRLLLRYDFPISFMQFSYLVPNKNRFISEQNMSLVFSSPCLNAMV